MVINFVSDRRKKLSREQESDKQYLKLASIVLVITCFVYVVALGISIYFQSQISRVKEQQELKRQAILDKEPIEKSYSIFANKLTVLTELYEKRKDKQEALAFFSRLFGTDVEVVGLNYTADSDILSFSLRSRNIFVMEEVFTTLDGPEVRERYPVIAKSGLSRGGDGTYSMSLTISLRGEEIEE